MNSIEHLIRTRRAIRRYEPTAVSLQLISHLLETAMWAPSAHNRQPWRFAVLTNLADKERLARAMGQRLRQDRTNDGDDPELIEKDVMRSFSRLTQAPTLIILCLSMEDMDQYPDRRRTEAERTMAIQSVAMAAQNLWLSAHAHGLGCCWICAPLFVPNLVKETCQLPTDWEPLGILTLGYPAQKREKERHDWQSKVVFK